MNIIKSKKSENTYYNPFGFVGKRHLDDWRVRLGGDRAGYFGIGPNEQRKEIGGSLDTLAKTYRYDI